MPRTELGEALCQWAAAHAAAAERMRPVMEALACIAQGATPFVQMPDGLRAIGDAIAAATEGMPHPGIEALAALAERAAPIFEAQAALVRRLEPAFQAWPSFPTPS